MTNAPLPKPARILLTNDDGIDAPGMAALRAALAGNPDWDVLVVAPLGERSGTGCGLSLVREFRVDPRRDAEGRIWGYSVDGTPADCVKFALVGLGDYRPDLVLSGVNRGMNVGNSVFYSGTVACAIEATFFGLRAMATSLGAYRAPVLHFDTAAQVARALVPWLLSQQWQPRSFWNLNVPNLTLEELQGVRFARQGTSFFTDDFRLVRTEGETRFYANMGTQLQQSPEPDDSDDRILETNAASLSLLSIDLTVDAPASAREALEFEWRALLANQPRKV